MRSKHPHVKQSSPRGPRPLELLPFHKRSLRAHAEGRERGVDIMDTTAAVTLRKANAFIERHHRRDGGRDAEPTFRRVAERPMRGRRGKSEASR